MPQSAPAAQQKPLTEQVDGDDGLGPGCQSRGRPAGIDQQVLRVDVDGHRHRTDPAHCLGGCDERVGREDDFPACCDPGSAQRQFQGIGQLATPTQFPAPGPGIGLLEFGHGGA